VKRDWRHRILRLSSSGAIETVITGFAIAVMAIAVVATASRSGFICLVFVVVIFSGLVLARKRFRPRRIATLAWLACVVAVAMSWGRSDTLMQRFETASTDVRPAVWRDTVRIIKDFPLTGTGLNTYGIAMLHYQTVQDGYQYIESHNDYLQLAAEGGLLLGVPALLALLIFIRDVRHRFREAADDTTTYWLRAGAVTGLCAVAVQEFLDFTVQMPGAAALFVVLAAIAIHPSRGTRSLAGSHASGCAVV
jgi:O-antigen ligase